MRNLFLTKVAGGVWGCLAAALATAAAQPLDLPLINSIACQTNTAIVTVATPAWAKQVTLETRKAAEAGTWTRCAWQGVTNPAASTLLAEGGKPRQFFRACAYSSPSFTERVTLGFGLVTSSYPGAVLLEVDATHPTSGYSTDPNDISQLRIVCRVTGGTAIIQSTGPSTFGPITYDPRPWLGDMDISWPVPMDVMEADILLKKAGYGAAYNTINLRQPVYPGMVEPYYIFQVQGVVGFVFIGSHSKTNFIGH